MLMNMKFTYVDNVGLMHTGKPGFKHREKRPELRVEYIHIGALLGYVLNVAPITFAPP